MITLKAQKRESGQAKVMRRDGLLPAVVYGRKEASTPISIVLEDFEKALSEAGESSVVSLEGIGEVKNVLIQEVVRHAVSGLILHADLYAIEKGQKVTVSIPLKFIGVSGAVKDSGGILVKVAHELEIEAQPQDLPREINVDISALIDIDSQIHVSDLVIPAGVTVLAELDEVIAMIAVAKEEKEEAVLDITQIEVEKKGKKEEEGEAGATPAASGKAPAGKK